MNSELEKSDIIICHNSKFDRPFIEKHSEVAKLKNWGCSLTEIDWLYKFKFQTQNLTDLCRYHGFYFEAHRALKDCKALLHLLTHQTFIDKSNYLKELLVESSKPKKLVIAYKVPYHKDNNKLMSTESFRFDKSTEALWWKYIDSEDLDRTIAVISSVYNENIKPIITTLNLSSKERFKSITEVLLLKESLKLTEYNPHFDCKYVIVINHQTTKEQRIQLKERQYDYHNEKQVWWLLIEDGFKDKEKQWLKDNFYDHGVFQGQIITNKYYRDKSE